MKICKWAGDPADEYCKSCDGIKMMVEGIEKSCTECNGYEEGTEEVTEEVKDTVATEEKSVKTEIETTTRDIYMINPSTGEKKHIPVGSDITIATELVNDGWEKITKKTFEVTIKTTETPENESKNEEIVNNTPITKKAEKTTNNKVEKVSEEKEVKETVDTDGITVTSLRYTSSATVKKGDNYYKFTAEEEWNTNNYKGNIEDVREQLWATLNAEVDKQIEDLQNM